MAMIRSITITENLTPALRKVAEGVSDLSEPMADIAGKWLINTHDRFRAEISPAGVPWDKNRRAIAEGNATLFKSGALFNAIDKAFGANFAQIGVEETAGPAIYALVHQEGAVITAARGKALNTPYGPFKSVTIPARPYVGFAEEDEVMAVEFLSAHLQKLFDSGAAAVPA